MISSQQCPLCHSHHLDVFYQDKRDYYQCLICYLVFVAKHQKLTLKNEKAIYDQHNNSPDDPHYRQFLSRLMNPVLKAIKPQSSGLDFGSGPGPTLAIMFAEQGHSVKNYDIFYADDKNVFNTQYDFICATEVAEHLSYPKEELAQLWACLKDNGILALMTKRVISKEAFAQWHYKNDQTHICFFSVKTFQWLADNWQAEVSFPEKDVVLFKKKSI
jgi:2-polyprenyl-3-methyl-5-hydroxy-6-metoxy-1,4-benzoquinol methylase